MSALSVDDVIADLPLPDQFGYQLRRVLQVGVNHNNSVTRSILQTGGHRNFLAEVAAHIDQGDAMNGLPEMINEA